MEVDLSAYSSSNPEYRKRMRDGLMDSISEYSDEAEVKEILYEDLGHTLKDLHRYHQEKASALKGLLIKLGYH
jgi:hypothetical protein